MKPQFKSGDVCWHLSISESGACSIPIKSVWESDGVVTWIHPNPDDPTQFVQMEEHDMLFATEDEAGDEFDRRSQRFLDRALRGLQDYARVMRNGMAINPVRYKAINDALDVAREAIYE